MNSPVKFFCLLLPLCYHVIILLPFSLPLYFSFALPLSIHSSSVSFCLPAFFTILFSPSSHPDSFCLPAFIADIFSVCSNLVSFCLPVFFTEIFFFCSCPVSFYLPTFFAKICLLLLILTRSLWRSSSLAVSELILALFHFLFALCLKPVVCTLKSLCCCLLT